MAQTYPAMALAPSPYYFAYPAPPSSTLPPSSTASSSLPSSSAGLFRFEKPGHSASLSHGASTTSPSNHTQSHSPSVAGRPRGRTFLVQHYPTAAASSGAAASPSGVKRRFQIPPQPLRLSQTNKNNNNNNNNNSSHPVETSSPPLSYASDPTSSARYYTFPSTPLSVAPIPSSSSSSLPSGSVSSAVPHSSPSQHQSQHPVYSAGPAPARRRSSAAGGGTFYRQQQQQHHTRSAASYHSRNPSYYTHSGNRDYAVMQLVHYPTTPIWSYPRHDTSQPHQHDSHGLSQSQIGKRKRAPSSYTLTEDPRETLDDDDDRSRLRKSQRPSVALPEVPAEAETTVHVKEEVIEETADTMLAAASPTILEDQPSSSSPDTANSTAVSSATSLAVHSFPLQYLSNRPHSSAELRPATPEEARGTSTIIGRRPVSAPMQSNSSSSQAPVASGLPSSLTGSSSPLKQSKSLGSLNISQTDAGVSRMSVEHAPRDLAQSIRPSSKSVSTGSALLAASDQQTSSSTLAYRRGQLAQEKARNLSIATSASQNPAQASTNLRTAPANPSYHHPQPSPTIAKSFSQARANAGPNTPRRASFAAPPAHHSYQHFSKSTGAPLLPHQQQTPLHHPQFIDGRPGPAIMPPSAGFMAHHRPTHHIPPLPLAHLPGPAMATPATGSMLTAAPIPHAMSRPTKAVFMQDMEALYDSLPDARAIQAHIDHMLDNAATNIGREIEDARNKRVEWEETMMKRTELFEQNITAELQLLEKKIARLEGGKAATSASPVTSSEANAAFHTQSSIQALLRRVEELEAANKARNITSSPRLNHRNSISRLPAISSEDHPTMRPMSSLRDT